MGFFPQVSETIRSGLSPSEAKDALRRLRVDLVGYTYHAEEAGRDALLLLPVHDGTLWTNSFVPILQARFRAEETGSVVEVTGELRRSVKILTAILICVLAAFAVLAAVLSFRNRVRLAVLLPVALFGGILLTLPHIGLRLTFARVLSQLRASLTP